jgi:dienelactone hydrolase/pimeloyl-ACP methyl ester carboxylesterase
MIVDVRYGHMVHEYATARVREILQGREARVRSLRTRRQAERYVQDVREAVARAFGRLPGRTPLRPRLAGARELELCAIQPLCFESRPGLTVTANLYLPRHGSPPYPAVLGLCGHAAAGKAYDRYQSFCQGLAAKGFLVLIIDPVGQGERVQFRSVDRQMTDLRRADQRTAGLREGPRATRPPSILPGVCDGHNMIGNQLALLGGFLGSWRVWDAIRAVDYLVSRPDVDPRRIGVTGNSGGGTLSAYLTALEPRLAMAAPGCFVCSYGANLENENPTDTEQNPPGILAGGLDHVDLLLCHAPRPTLIMAQHDDYFDARAARRAYEELRRVHELLGSRGSAAWFCGPHGHGFTRENREAMYRFFMKTAGVRGASAEPAVRLLPAGRLHAAGGEAPGRRVFDFILEEAGRLCRSRGSVDGTDLERRARAVLGLPRRRKATVPPYRCLVSQRHREPHLRAQSVFAVESEPGIQVIVSTFGLEQELMHPPRGEVRVYVGHGSGERDLRTVPAVLALTRSRIPLVVVEPRGFGPTRTLACGSRRFLEPYGADFLLASIGEMLGESYLGKRVHDLMCALDFLAARGAERVQLVGRGLGSVIAALAGLLHPCRPEVRLLDYLPSFTALCRDPLANWPLSSLPHGVLRSFDLPDVYRELGRQLELRKPASSRLDPRELP